MPIHGLTNTARQFVQLGSIRKGEMQAARSDPSKSKPVDLDYFRVTFKPGEKAAALEQEFKRVYGDRPRRINIRLPFQNVDQCWDAVYECYKQGGLIAQAGTRDTGPYWIYYRDPDPVSVSGGKTDSEVLVRGGQPVGERGRAFFDKPFTVDTPIYINAKKEPVLMEPAGRFTVVIPELAGLDVGYFLFSPKSPRDIRNISAELGVYADIAKQYGGTLSGMPLQLVRREEDVTKNIDGKLSKGKSWVIHVELTGDFGRLALEAIDRLALPDIIDADVTEGDVEEDFPMSGTPGPMVGEAMRLASKNQPIEVKAEPTKMSFDEAKQVIVKVQKKDKFMSELNKEQLNWLILNSKDEHHVQAASIVLLEKG